MKQHTLAFPFPWLHGFWLLLLAVVFAQVEIQIEGPHGWAAGLPTWRVESHILLDIFWGGRPFTGYHLWVFSFMALVFHWPIFLVGQWNPKLEARILGSLMLFWLVEDFLWFVMNPAYGLGKFSPGFVPWHKHWLLHVPTDYLVFLVLGLLLLRWSYTPDQGRREEWYLHRRLD